MHNEPTIEYLGGSVTLQELYKLPPAIRTKRFVDMARGAEGELYYLRALLMAHVSGVNEDGELDKFFDVGMITARLDTVEARSDFPIRKPMEPRI